MRLHLNTLVSISIFTIIYCLIFLVAGAPYLSQDDKTDRSSVNKDINYRFRTRESEDREGSAFQILDGLSDMSCRNLEEACNVFYRCCTGYSCVNQANPITKDPMRNGFCKTVIADSELKK